MVAGKLCSRPNRVCIARPAEEKEEGKEDKEEEGEEEGEEEEEDRAGEFALLWFQSFKRTGSS